MSKHKLHTRSPIFGFTIIEVMIVVVVIGILASVVAVAGAGYINRSDEAAIKSNLATAAAAMKQEYDQEGSYPTELPAALDASADTLTLNGGGTGYCIEGVKGSATFYITQNNATPQQGSCPVVPPPPPPPPAPSVAIAPSSQRWNASTTNLGSYAVTVTGGTAPYTFVSLTGNNITPSNSYPSDSRYRQWGNWDHVLFNVTGNGPTYTITVNNYTCPDVVLQLNTDFSNTLQLNIKDANNVTASGSFSLTLFRNSAACPD